MRTYSILCLLVFTFACGDDSSPDVDGGSLDGSLDSGAPDGALDDGGDRDASSTDAGGSDAALDSNVDSGGILPPTEFRGIPQRPYADVATPSSGTIAVGAATCIGTPEAPAFLIGDGTEYTPPGGAWEIQAEYCIIANVNVNGRLLVRNATMVEIRDSEVHHSRRAGISLGGTDLAVVDSHIHHACGNNGHGVTPGCGSQRIWVGGNLFEHNDEDGFQAGHNCDGSTPPDEIYFYGNTCINNRENCFDIKWVNRSVVSGNLMTRHRPARDGENFIYDDGSEDCDVSSGSDGSAVVIGSDGTPTTTFFFDNEYWENTGCVRVEDAVDVWASGELCRDALEGSSWGGYKFDKSGHTRLVSSTFRAVPFMITDDWRDGIIIDEADNVREGGTELRQGFNATLTSGGITEADVAAAYEAAFGRAP